MNLTKCLLSFVLITVLLSPIIKADDQSCSCACIQLCDEPCTVLSKSGQIYGKNVYVPRSQSSNLARQLMGVEEKIHKFGNECFYGVGTVAVEYQQMFNGSDRNISKWFSSTGNATMSYGLNPTPATNTNNLDLNGYNWGYTGSGTVSFCPKKNDFIVDLNVYLGLDSLFCGMWARLDIPFVRTSFDVGLIDSQTGDPSAFLEANLYGASADFAKVYNTFKDALKGDKAVGDLPVLKYAKICGKQTTSSLANIRFIWGYDWFRRECWHFASGLLFVAPVGTKPTAEYMFEPIVGNYRRLEIGSITNAAYEIWQNCDATQTVSVFLDAYMTTIFPGCNKRTLSIKPENLSIENRTWSQYLMLKTYDSSNQVVGQERVANISTGDLKVGASIEGALAVMLQWNCNCLMSGLGYELWGRSREHARYRCFEIDKNKYALQGLSLWDGTTTSGVTGNNANAPTSDISTAGTTTSFTTGSYLTDDDLDVCSALHPGAHSNKIFGFFGYNWCECTWQPFVLIGGEAEFGSSDAAVSQWGIIAKGGVNF